MAAPPPLMRTDGVFSRPSLTLSFIAPRSDASRFRSFGPEDEAFGGAFFI